jgi:selT/selW/selH-like putative selenoprotein
MIEGSGGVFDVHVDGKQIWSKHDVGRFPEHKEILGKIKALAPRAK